MIDFIRGPVFDQQNDSVTIEVNGLGYRVFIPANVSLKQGETVFLYTHLVIREDAHTLYGFPSKEERDLFRLLLEVSGIGPKAGLMILSTGNPKQIVTAIQLEDVKFLTKIPGIGKKTAQRLILDLKDKCKEWVLDFSDQELQDQQSVQRQLPIDREAIDALMGLGYNEDEARQAVQSVLQANHEQELSTEELIKRALQVSIRR